MLKNFWTAISIVVLAAMATVAEADSVAVPARELSDKSSNVVPIEQRWDGLAVCHGNDGMQEWTVDVKKPGPHYIHFQYASGENHPKAGNNHYLPPMSLGAYASELFKYLKKDHYDVHLSPEERIRVTTWIDCNGTTETKHETLATPGIFVPLAEVGTKQWGGPDGAIITKVANVHTDSAVRHADKKLNDYFLGGG